MSHMFEGARDRLDDIFPLGPGPLAVLCAAIISGITIPFIRSGPETDLEVWTFASNHYGAYEAAIPSFESQCQVKVSLRLLTLRALFARMSSAFQTGVGGPDCAELVQSWVGRFFRGPLEDIGFYDLTDHLHRTGWYDRINEASFAPWTNRGRIFGLPHDVHPVVLAYRWDIFEKEGIDANSLTTWGKFVEAGRKITRDFDGDGAPDRYMIELNDSNAAEYEVLLLQRGGGSFDRHGNVTMDADLNVKTLVDYVHMAAGPNAIGKALGWGAIMTKAVEDGYFCCFLMPDWRCELFRQDIPRMAGKFKLMPLPAWEDGGRRTSVRGGTMMGISRNTKDFGRTWQLVKHLYLQPDQLAARFRDTTIIPPVKEAWDSPVFDQPDAYFSNQPVGRMYIEQAPHVPRRYTSPYTNVAYTKFAEALIAVVDYAKAHPRADLTPVARRALKRAADYVRKQIARNVYQSK